MTTSATPWNVLSDLVAQDPASPRITFYERTDGPSFGERVELSGKVLVNWVSKVANLLVEEFDASTGTHVYVHLPAAHWRTAYWCLGAWAVGCTVMFTDSDTEHHSDAFAATSDVLVSLGEDGDDGDHVVVTLPMLARQATVADLNGGVDEAKELATFGDVFHPLASPQAHQDGLIRRHGALTFEQLVTPSAPGRRYLPAPSPDALMSALAAHSGVMLVRGGVAADDLEQLLAQEGLA